MQFDAPVCEYLYIFCGQHFLWLYRLQLNQSSLPPSTQIDLQMIVSRC